MATKARKQNQARTALIISGGAPNATLVAGALVAFNEIGLKFDVISTAGAGALLGLMYCAPKDGDPAKTLLGLTEMGIADPLYEALPVNFKVFNKPGIMADVYRRALGLNPFVQKLMDWPARDPLSQLLKDCSELMLANASPSNQALLYFFEQIKLNSQGRHTGKVLCCAALGEPKDAISKFVTGELDFLLFNSATLSTDLPEIAVLGLPFMFRNPEHMMSALAGEVGQDLDGALREKGYILLAWYDGGARSFYARNKLLSYSSDFKDLKIRVANRPELLGMLKALGASTSTMAADKTPTALLSGDLDAAESDLTTYALSGHYKTAPYFTFTQHVAQPLALMISTKRWASLNEADRAIVRQSARESAAQAVRIRMQHESDIQAKLKKEGVKFGDFQSAATAISLIKTTYAPVTANPKAAGLMIKIMAGKRSQAE